jgi:hypothetical protein
MRIKVLNDVLNRRKITFQLAELCYLQMFDTDP